MTDLRDHPNGYGPVSRALHWGMAALFGAQFLSAAAHWGLPRESALRETLWSYHVTLGTTLFLLVLLRGAWGLANMSRRPKLSGFAGQAALAGHLALYALMVIVPALRLLAAAGSPRGLTYLGLQVFPPQATEVAWMMAPAEWHGELGWILALLVLGHAGMAVIWHRLVLRDDVLAHMTG